MLEYNCLLINKTKGKIMLEKIVIALTSRVSMILLGWFAVVSIGLLTSAVSMGKAAFEDNTETNKKLIMQVKTFSEDMAEFKILVTGVRKSDFKGQLKDLYKQAYKIENDPKDIKSVDMVSAVDFCGGELFESYSASLPGSDLVTAADYCERAEYWIKNN